MEASFGVTKPPLSRPLKDADSFRFGPFIRLIKINERLLTVLFVGVGTSVHRRFSCQLLCALTVGGMRCVYAYDGRIVLVICVRRPKS